MELPAEKEIIEIVPLAEPWEREPAEPTEVPEPAEVPQEVPA